MMDAAVSGGGEEYYDVRLSAETVTVALAKKSGRRRIRGPFSVVTPC
jgi:hypothetical protein